MDIYGQIILILIGPNLAKLWRIYIYIDTILAVGTILPLFFSNNIINIKKIPINTNCAIKILE